MVLFGQLASDISDPAIAWRDGRRICGRRLYRPYRASGSRPSRQDGPTSGRRAFAPYSVIPNRAVRLGAWSGRSSRVTTRGKLTGAGVFRRVRQVLRAGGRAADSDRRGRQFMPGLGLSHRPRAQNRCVGGGQFGLDDHQAHGDRPGQFEPLKCRLVLRPSFGWPDCAISNHDKSSPLVGGISTILSQILHGDGQSARQGQFGLLRQQLEEALQELQRR